MRKLLSVGVLSSLLVFSSLLWAENQKDDDDEVPSIVVIDGNKPTKFFGAAIVRVWNDGPAGSELTAQVKGEGKLLRTVMVSDRKSGDEVNKVGVIKQEYEIQLNPGETTVILTSKFLQNEPKTKTYKFTVEK